MKTKQTGFAVLESLLILVIIAIIGGTGYFVWHSKQQTDKTLDNTSNSAGSTASKTSASSQASGGNSQKYLTIKEYGVKFQLSTAISDAYYAKNGNYLYFSVHRFDNMKGAEGCRAQTTESGSLGLVGLVTGRVGEDNGTPAGGTWTQTDLDSSGLKNVDGTYYGFQGGNAPCWDIDNPPAPDFTQTVSDIKQAFYAQQSTFVKA